MKEINYKRLLKEITKLKGSSKRKTTNEQLHKAEEKTFKILEKKFGIK